MPNPHPPINRAAKAETKGWVAQRNGEAKESNPYPPTHRLHDSWLKGYVDSLRLRDIADEDDDENHPDICECQRCYFLRQERESNSEN